MDWMNGSV